MDPATHEDGLNMGIVWATVMLQNVPDRNSIDVDELLRNCDGHRAQLVPRDRQTPEFLKGFEQGARAQFELDGHKSN